jgi:Zn-finger nucleic acid-binding protein
MLALMDRTGPYRDRPRPKRPLGSGEYDCPACATRVRDDVRACPSCGAPIATLRCAHCFHMNVPEAALCLGCGHELGLAPLGKPDELACPDCKRAFVSFSGAGGRLRDCGRCGGQFVEHKLLEALLTRREVYGNAANKSPARHNPLDSPVRYRPCPVCGDLMTRKNFGHSSGIIVDVCKLHGMWFDPGELPRVLAFVEAGGLSLARRREQEQRRADEPRQRVRQSERRLVTLSQPLDPLRRVASAGLGLDAAIALYDYLRELTR